MIKFKKKQRFIGIHSMRGWTVTMMHGDALQEKDAQKD